MIKRQYQQVVASRINIQELRRLLHSLVLAVSQRRIDLRDGIDPLFNGSVITRNA